MFDRISQHYVLNILNATCFVGDVWCFTPLWTIFHNEDSDQHIMVGRIRSVTLANPGPSIFSNTHRILLNLTYCIGYTQFQNGVSLAEKMRRSPWGMVLESYLPCHCGLRFGRGGEWRRWTPLPMWPHHRHSDLVHATMVKSLFVRHK